jgi:hypothetical protein
MGLSDAVNDWKNLISNIPTQYYAVFSKKYNFFVFKLLILLWRHPALCAFTIRRLLLSGRFSKALMVTRHVCFCFHLRYPCCDVLQIIQSQDYACGFFS